MRVLIVGNGGREHALAWALAASPLATEILVAPGNAGTALVARNCAVAATDVAGLLRLAQAERVDLVVPGGETSLVLGLADACAAAGLPCCGPTQAAAQLEGSKAFTKQVADEAGIPTARWERFEAADEAHDFIARRGAPIVVKADGLAGGKGVVVAATEAEAVAAVDQFIAGGPVVIEECLEGDEISLFALCDGADAVLLGVAQDHKRVGDGDTGPNTGGMGAVSPVPGFDPGPAMDVFIRPALAAMAARGTPFRGFLYAGLMLTADGPRLIEYNVRLGDPEAQCLLPRLRSDLLPALLAACEGELSGITLMLRDLASCVVVMAAPGYPEAPVAGSRIGGLAHAAEVPGLHIFHAGTRSEGDAVVAAGGRVLNLVGTAPDLLTARATAYAGVDLVDWPEGFCRSDIGLRALR